MQNVSNKLKIDIFFHIFVVKVFSLEKLDGSPSCWGAFILDYLTFGVCLQFYYFFSAQKYLNFILHVCCIFSRDLRR